MNGARAVGDREKLVSNPHRPQYHFSPPANWMNDPNGLIQWQGQYHLFYQYHPYKPVHGLMYWGHAVSSDLVYWTDLPIALTPTLGRADAGGCWSGCAIDNNGIPTLLYTGVYAGDYPQVVCLATSADDLLTWQYDPGNPIIAGPPTELVEGTGGNFRDPFIWSENDIWYLLMGSKQEGVGGLILLYRSTDLTHWEYLHPFLVGDGSAPQPVWTGTMWECPNFLTFGDQRLLLFSVQDNQGSLLYPLYVTGTFQDEQFLPQTQGILAYGGSFYAPQVMRDEQGRYIMWGWLMEGRKIPLLGEDSFAGVMSLPIIVAPFSGGRLSLEPAPELNVLRGEHWCYEGVELNGTRNFLQEEDIRDTCLEILIECEPGRDSEFGFRLRCSPDGQEQTSIVYLAESRQVSIEREQSSINPEVERENCSVVVEGDEDERVRLHIFLDHSVIEVFVNGHCYLASRIYPMRTDSLGLELFTRKRSVSVKALDIWRMGSMWDS